MKAAFKDFASNAANEKNLANQIGENFGEETQKIFEITNSIYGQDILSSFLFRNSSAPSSSCGAVSVYNALILLGKKVLISDSKSLLNNAKFAAVTVSVKTNDNSLFLFYIGFSGLKMLLLL